MSDLKAYTHTLTEVTKYFRPVTVKKMGTVYDEKNNKLLPHGGWKLDPKAEVSKEAKKVVAEVKKEAAPKAKSPIKNAAKELLQNSK